ncbi:MAG: GNAT family N-acetyltransferase [Parvularculaceae bacterium]
MTVAIRRARNDEAETLAALGAATFTATFGHLYSRENLEKFLAKSHSAEVYRALLADPQSAVWLAEDGAGRALGYAVAGPCALPVPQMPARSGELARLYLVKEAQGSGLGALMLAEALSFLRSHFGHIYLSVYRDNIPAQKLYARHGFVKIHDYFYMVGDHADPEWIMELKR